MDPSNTTPIEPDAVAPETIPASEAVPVPETMSAPEVAPTPEAVPAPETMSAPEVVPTPEAMSASEPVTTTGPAPTPVEPTESIAPVEPAQPVEPVETAAPVSPIEPVAPATEPAMVAPSVSPVNPDIENATLNSPVNPVVTPNPTPNSATATGTMSMNQMFQAQPATKADVFAETTAIAVPEGPKAPDPVEEELKAPLKATAPVPGSIGSAVSGPASGNMSTGGVPAMDAATNPMVAAPINPDGSVVVNAPVVNKQSFFDKIAAKSKMNKKTLIILCVVAGVLLVALIILLILIASGAM